MFKKAASLTIKPYAYANDLGIIRKSIFSWNRLRDRTVTCFSKLHEIGKNIHVHIHKHKHIHVLLFLFVAFIFSLHICISAKSKNRSTLLYVCVYGYVHVYFCLYTCNVENHVTPLSFDRFQRSRRHMKAEKVEFLMMHKSLLYAQSFMVKPEAF